MTQLLKKEFRLTASVLSYVFTAFALMTLIPNYPILLCAFFVCFGIFHSFQKAREANDIMYSCLLPVKKVDIVKAKYLFAVSIQSAAFILMIAFAVLRLFVLNGVQPYSFNSMLNANMAFLGYVLIVYACFNILFVGGFFKTAYKMGMPFLSFGIAAFIVIVLSEALHFFPFLDVLNANFHWSQIIVFCIGAALYAVGTLLSLKTSCARFEKIDL